VPHQDVDVQTAATAHQLVQELAELELRPVVPGAEQTRTAVEIPACDENRAARVASGGYESPEIGVGVDEEGGARGVLQSPTIATHVEQVRLTCVLRHVSAATRAALRRFLHASAATSRFARRLHQDSLNASCVRGAHI